MRFGKVFNVVGCHAGGEIGNVVVGGVGDVPGSTVFEKRMYLEKHRDDIRQLLLKEPRRSMIRAANIVLPATDPEAAMGFVIMESEEYPAMSGSNTICVATLLLETGMVPMQEPVTELALESPAGLIRLRCECRDGKVISVRFTNQPASCITRAPRWRSRASEPWRSMSLGAEWRTPWLMLPALVLTFIPRKPGLCASLDRRSRKLPLSSLKPSTLKTPSSPASRRPNSPARYAGRMVC